MVYTLSTASTQLGFLIGPVGGSAVMANSGFGVMCVMLGAVMWLYSPLLPMIYNRQGDDDSGTPTVIYADKLDEDGERADLLGAIGS